jgi:putative ABC transport system ATP-binding protein
MPTADGAQPPSTNGSSGSAPLLVATDVHKTYRTGAETVDALKGIDLTVAAGEFVAVMGPPGSGKTTLLNCLSGLDDIDSGSVTVGGRNIHTMSDSDRTRHRAEAMGFIFQAFNLIPVFTAIENVELPLLLAGVDPRQARRSAQETLERVGLGQRLNHRPTELSGGEQQRVTIARALAGRPAIVWADEPTGNLDSETAGAVMELLAELHRDGLTVMLVTHDEDIGGSAQRRIIVRDGVIVADEVPKPRARTTATRAGRSTTATKATKAPKSSKASKAAAKSATN